MDLQTLEDEGYTCLWNTGIQLNCDSVSYPRRKIPHNRVFYGLVLIQTKQYGSATTSMGNMFQDLTWLHETADNTEHYI
jgi:hypothetical protein